MITDGSSSQNASTKRKLGSKIFQKATKLSADLDTLCYKESGAKINQFQRGIDIELTKISEEIQKMAHEAEFSRIWVRHMQEIYLDLTYENLAGLNFFSRVCILVNTQDNDIHTLETE